MRMQLHQLMDACLFAISFWLAYRVRTSPELIAWFGLKQFNVAFESFVWLYVLLIPAAPLVLEAQGFYARSPRCSRFTTAWLLFKGCALTSLGLIIVLFSFNMLIARWIVIWFGFTSFLLVFFKEEAIRLLSRSDLAQSQYKRRFVLVGTKEETVRMREELLANNPDGFEIQAELDLNRTSVQELVQVLHEHSVNGVLLSAQRSFFEQIEAAIRVCELEGVEAWLVADFFKTQISRATFDDFYGRPILVFRSAPEASWQGVLKQVLDFVCALVLVILSAVPLLVVAIVIKLTSPGPILFRQQRSGLNGRPFTIYKFRTMVSDAEQRKHELAAMNEMSGPVFKVTHDPRITRIGRVLRKFSIDEFPQLFNVVRGEMSLVGPRPLPVDETRRFNDLAYRRRLSVKPGLTCLWQISGRNNVKDFKDWVRLDLEYIDNWSLWLDLKILWLTIPVVLTGAGAK